MKVRFGIIKIIINDSNVEYDYDRLSTVLIGNQGLPVFDVTQRFKISLKTENLPQKSIVKCVFSCNNFDLCCIDTGERLALKTWEKQGVMFSIGTEDELNDRYVTYLETGIQINFTETMESDKIIFGLAWTTINDAEVENNYTWYAADPTYAE